VQAWLRARALRRALDFIHAPDGVPLRRVDLCAAAAASERTLEYALNEHLGVGPSAYLEARRPGGVRPALLRGSTGNARITDLAAGCGVGRLGQLAADYRRRFGELPQERLAGR
jgi:AraC family ethanolamine operon transcriptional activator